MDNNKINEDLFVDYWSIVHLVKENILNYCIKEINHFNFNRVGTLIKIEPYLNLSY